MSSWLSGMERNFAEKLDLCYFSFHAADFPTSAISTVFKSSVTEQEELVRTERLPLQSIRCTCRSTRCCQPISCRSGPGRCTAHAACLQLQDARGFVRGKSSDAVWPGLEAYRRWSPFLHLFALSVSALVSSWHDDHDSELELVEFVVVLPVLSEC